METEKQKTLVRASMNCAISGKLNLTNEQLRSLFKECYIMAGCLGDFYTHVTASAALAHANAKLSQFEEAITLYTVFLKSVKQIGDKTGEGAAYCELGNCYFSLGHYNKAIQYFEMHLNIAKQVGDTTNEGGAYGNLGNCYCSLGQYDKAITHHEMRLNITKQIKDKAGEGDVYCNLGICYRFLGQYNKAAEHHRMHLNIAKQIGDKATEGRAYGNLGISYNTLGQNNKAIKHHEKNLNIAKQIGDKAMEGRVYVGLGSCYRSLRQYDKAVKYHEMALNISKQIGDKAGEGRAYANLGICYMFLGHYDNAIRYYELSLSIAKQIGDKAGEQDAYSKLGMCYYFLRQYNKAESILRESIQCLEKLFENTPKQDEAKISIRETFVLSFKTLIKVLVLQETTEKTNEALFIAERGRARALAELMCASYFVESTKSTRDNVLDLVGIHEIARSMGSTVLFLSLTNDGIYMWIIQRNGCIKFEKNCIVVSAQTKDHSPNQGVIPVTEQLKTLISKLRKSRSTVRCEDRSLAFFYSEIESEQTAMGFPKVDVSSSLPHFGETEMEPKVFASTTSAAGTDKRNIFEEHEEGTESNVLEELYRMVLAPVRHIVEGSQLVIVPEGPLNLVPFSALMDGHGRYVAESLQVRLIPSLTTAKMIVENQLDPNGQGRPLIVGDPDAGSSSRLPGANKEARMVAALFNTEPLTGKEATKEKFLESVENANLIHIAAHGNMERGGILFAPNPSDINNTTKPKKEDKMLIMSDLDKKRLKAKLVVLSCCHSAQGEIRADGVVGMARAFLGAGARSVLVALWAIDDGATLYFMRKFYENLACGETAGQSLNNSMAATRAHAQYNNPQHWAPFVLIGDDVTVC